MTSQRQHRLTVLLAFGLVYLFWGSTYLAIDIAVQHIPPALTCGLRFSIAGVMMLLYCALSGRQVRASKWELLRFAIVGVLLLTGGNLTLSWAEQYVPSGLAALIVAVTPIWFLIIDTWLLRGDRVSGRGLAGIGLGIVGMVVLLWPQLLSGSTLGRWGLIASFSLLGGSLSWAIGSVLSKRWEHGGDPFVGGGWQMLFAGLSNLLITFATGEYHRVQWSRHSVEALIYLIIFGSWVGYTAYIYILKHAPTAKVSTYAYVNPVIAVFLGWLILHERVDGFMLAGTAVIIAAVILVTSAKVKPAGVEHSDLQAVETTGD